MLDVKAGGKPRWLSLLGDSGTGKTYLASRIHRWAMDHAPLRTRTVDGEIQFATDWCRWPELAEQLQANGGHTYFDQIKSTQLLFIDDIGQSLDKTGFITGKLSTLLSARVGKWTVITANLPLREVAAKIDTRVASRMVRDKNVVVNVEAMDYALRTTPRP